MKTGKKTFNSRLHLSSIFEQYIQPVLWIRKKFIPDPGPSSSGSEMNRIWSKIT